jgi:TetR/AcrR family transcriptional regulator, repressor for neighboring sulfatase
MVAGKAVAKARPRGRDEIVAAVVQAATELIAARGPAAVSLRDVARAAHVTLSQIHRHVGNKDDLLVAVLAEEVESGAPAQGPDLATFLRTLFRLDVALRTRLQARIILDGYDLLALQSRFPGIEVGTTLLRETVPDDEARVRAAVFASFFAGWQLLGPAYLRVTGADDLTPERFDEVLAPMLDAMANASSAPAAKPGEARGRRDRPHG